MTELTLLRREQLENGLVLEFFDHSNRYFGDYHKVRVEVHSRLPLRIDLFQDEADPAAALAQTAALLGDAPLEVRQLERMGVPGAEVERVRTALIDDFLRTGSIYLARPDYPQRLLRQKLAVARPRPFLPRGER
ncbi:hypothetical protein JCM30471_05740 [Desulfuromonas carbonis]|uniref:hypothetical protein n=1 Tax=Desulfuromonas sp. DDH964 TaxID=1823759 RepID=UPI00078CA527|nr:hypothetical protein [Desulfuromonas sp. DDH964]AMV72074.1 hypothetical protein DBW_1716 [Desulfuromonas sp. DDH964]